MSHADVVPTASGRRRWHLGLPLLVAALALCVLPGAAEAKKKRDKIGVATYNLYLGSDLGPATQAGLANRTDKFADEVGFVRSDVAANDFSSRAKHISQDIRDRKIDLVGLQEAALWRFSTPTDGGGPSAANPNAKLADTVYIDYLDTLLGQLNKDAKSKKTCAKEVRKAKSTPGKKDDRKARSCYRGYTLVVAQQEADLEFPADFDNNPGPNGLTYDVSASATTPCPGTPAGAPNGPGCWLQGNDDTGFNLGEPPAAQCSDGRDNDGNGTTDWGGDPKCTGQTDNVEGRPAQCADGQDNDGDGFTDAGADPECVDPPGPAPAQFDDSEANAGFQSKPQGLPQDANFDSHVFSGAPGPPIDTSGNGRDSATEFDCNPPLPGPQDTNPSEGPTLGEGGVWPFAGYDGDQDPNVAGSQVPVCLFHGIDGDLRLTMRDAIIKRKGARVKTRHSASGNFSQGSTFSVNVFGSPVRFTRGWTATDAKVRGKSFRFVNTHLESESAATFREDQASELVAPGGVASQPNTVLVGDLNSDPNRQATNLPNGDGGSSIAINRLFAAGFQMLTPPDLKTASHGDHGDVINDPNDLMGEGFIDHILTNAPGSIQRRGPVWYLDGFEDGLWQSDHAGVLVRIKGKLKGKKKK